MAYTRVSNNYGNYGGLVSLLALRGVPIDVSGCFPHLLPQSQQRAQEIARIIEQYPEDTKELARDFQKAMSDARGAGFCPFVDGHGPIVEFSRSVHRRALAIPQQAAARKQREEMEALRSEMDTLRNKPGQTIVKTSAPAASASSVVQQVKAAERAEKVSKEGGEVKGSGGKTVKEALAPGQRQTRFMRSTNKPGANLHPDDWRNLAKLAPANFDEQKYLARHADVAKAVKMKAMPSGLWHYVKYGKGEGRALAGYRRPGFLAGIFANWDQRGW